MMQAMQPMPVKGADVRIAEALELYRSGSLQPALDIFEENQADDAWFVRTYPYLHEIRLGLMAALSPDSAEWQKIKQADQVASTRFDQLRDDPAIPQEDDAHAIRGSAEDDDI